MEKNVFLPPLRLPWCLWGLKGLSIHFVQRLQALFDVWEKRVPTAGIFMSLCVADDALGPRLGRKKDEGNSESNEEPTSTIWSPKK